MAPEGEDIDVEDNDDEDHSSRTVTTVSPLPPPTIQSSSQLPTAPDWLLDNIAEASKTSGRIYSIFLGLLAYCALTVVSTTDRQLLFDEPARLPLVNLGVPLVGFFILSPVLCLLVFVYLQLYLHRIKGMISQLREQYAPIEKRRLYPWMLTIAEEPEPGTIGTLQKGIVTTSLWWSLPVVLFLFPIWFTKKHEPVLSYVVSAIPLIGLWSVVWFWHRYEARRRWGRVAMAILGTFASAAMLFWFIPSVNEGRFSEVNPLAEDSTIPKRFLKGITSINLSHEVLVTKPDEDYETIYWADLHGVHLEGAALDSSVLKRVNLRGAFLQRSHLSKAILDGAFLASAHLEGADFEEANLRGAHLQHAHLERAHLRHAHLEGADLEDAHLEKADLEDAHLETANLYTAHVEGAHLQHAHLEGAYLASAHLKGADFEDAHLEKADLKHAHLEGAYLLRADLKEAYLFIAYLEGADLRYAHLERADLLQARLKGADLAGANLRGVKNLTVEQLALAKTIYKAQLDDPLLKAIQKNYPHLLEPNKKEESRK